MCSSKQKIEPYLMISNLEIENAKLREINNSLKEENIVLKNKSRVNANEILDINQE
ncbi:hypothetical protein [Methanobrevibacter curvatus]|uniref:Uncharacterized protein n=1 Tax=Methanobrevibacter curvatus TaxID=49547 RepID=A0A166ALH0_9EURY|nr:hypothetical protein [Methanobrevibacter curvatus]KZX12192.1 hypothetical protein MBCUR_11420 [Methanobrevibacter curvatus]